MKYYSHNKMQEVNKEFTPKLIEELKALLVERYVDNMSTKDLVQYVMDDLDDLYKNMPDEEFIDEAKNYWDDSFGEVIDEIQDYMKTPFKQPLRESFEETN